MGSSCNWRINEDEIYSTAAACPLDLTLSRAYLDTNGNSADVVSPYDSAEAEENLVFYSNFYYYDGLGLAYWASRSELDISFYLKIL